MLHMRILEKLIFIKINSRLIKIIYWKHVLLIISATIFAIIINYIYYSMPRYINLIASLVIKSRYRVENNFSN